MSSFEVGEPILNSPYDAGTHRMVGPRRAQASAVLRPTRRRPKRSSSSPKRGPTSSKASPSRSTSRAQIAGRTGSRPFAVTPARWRRDRARRRSWGCWPRGRSSTRSRTVRMRGVFVRRHRRLTRVKGLASGQERRAPSPGSPVFDFHGNGAQGFSRPDLPRAFRFPELARGPSLAKPYGTANKPPLLVHEARRPDPDMMRSRGRTHGAPRNE